MKQGNRLEESGLIEVAQECLKSDTKETLVKTLTTRPDEIMNHPLTDDLTIVCAIRSQARDEGQTDDLFQRYPD